MVDIPGLHDVYWMGLNTVHHFESILKDWIYSIIDTSEWCWALPRSRNGANTSHLQKQDLDTVTTKVSKCRLEWLDHNTRMPKHHIMKIVFFNWVDHCRPSGGPRWRCKDILRRDMKTLRISELRGIIEICLVWDLYQTTPDQSTTIYYHTSSPWCIMWRLWKTL